MYWSSAKYPLFLSDFNEIVLFLKDLKKETKYQISLKSVQKKLCCSIWTVRWINNQTTNCLLMCLKMAYDKILGFQSSKNLDNNPLSYNTMFYINVRKFVTNFKTIWDFIFV